MLRKTHQGFALVGVLIALVIIGFLLWTGMKAYFKPAPAGSAVKGADINTSSYKSVVDSARKTAQDAANAKPREYPGLR